MDLCELNYVEKGIHWRNIAVSHGVQKMLTAKPQENWEAGQPHGPP